MAPRKKRSSKKWQVLLAEDDLETRAQLLKHLQPHATCTTVGTGEKAIEEYKKLSKKKKCYDFILLDITLPGIDGFEVLRFIRGFEETADHTSEKHSRILMVTAYKDSLMENYNMGWDDFITKPVDPQKLIRRMQILASRS